MNSKKFKMKALFNKAFFKEAFARFTTIGIVFACIAALIGYSDGNIFMAASRMISSMPILGYTNGASSWAIVVFIFFIVAGIHSATRLRNRNVYELYGSIPISKSEIWGTYLVAGIVWGAIVTLFGALGYAAPNMINGLRSSATVIPFEVMPFITGAVSAFIGGLFLYGFAGIVYNLTGKNLSAVLLAILAMTIPSQINMLILEQGNASLGLASLFLPVGLEVKNILSWVFEVIKTAASLFFSMLAFTSWRTEKSGSPAKSRIVHIVIGLLWAIEVILFCTNNHVFDVDKLGSFIVGNIIVSAIVYFIYMLITCKKFLKAVEMFMFYPISLVFVLGLFLFSDYIVKKMDDSIDFSADNIEYITIPENASGMLYNALYYYCSVVDVFSCSGTGTDGEENVRISDSLILKEVSEAIEYNRSLDVVLSLEYSEIASDLQSFYQQYYSDMMGAIYDDQYMQYNTLAPVSVKLKNGCIYNVMVGITPEFQEALIEQDDYMEKATDVSRFENGKLLYKKKEFNEVVEILVREMEALTPEERAVIYGYESFDYLDYANSLWRPDNDMVNVYGVITIASEDFSHTQTIKLTDHTPEAANLYMKLCNEEMLEHKGMDNFIERLENRDFEYLYVEFDVLEIESKVMLPGYIDYYEDPSCNDQVDWLADMLKRHPTPEDAEYVLIVDLSYISAGLYEEEELLNMIVLGNSYDLFNSMHDARLYIGMTRDEYLEMFELFGYTHGNMDDVVIGEI